MRILLVVACASLALPLTAAPSDRPVNACPVGGFPAISCPVINDEVVRQAVTMRLSGSVITRWTHVTVSVVDGVVTLSGTVESQSQSDLGTLLARTVRGVTAVRNRLCVAPGELGNVDLVGAVRRALSRERLLINGVTVHVNDGVVELRGMVASDFTRDQAGVVASGVPGVTAVHNNIVVQDPGAFGF